MVSMSSSKINTFHVLENVPISSAFCRISCLIVHPQTSAIVTEHTTIEPNDLGGTVTVLCRKAQVGLFFSWPKGMSDSPHSAIRFNFQQQHRRQSDERLS